MPSKTLPHPHLGLYSAVIYPLQLKTGDLLKAQWIFGSSQRDFSFLVLPGLLTAFIVHLYHPEGFWDEALAFFALAFCDSGHVYTTFWRTYANAKERGRTFLYWLVPFLVFWAVALWAFWDVRTLWSAVIFATVFHNYRQFHGILKWEQKINQDKDPWHARSLLALCFLPFLIFHFRDIQTEFVVEGALLHFPDTRLLNLGILFYLVVLISWAVRVLWQIYRGKNIAPVTLAIFTPAFLYALSFLWGRNIAEVLYPLVVAHGFAYMALMSLSLQRTQAPWQRGFIWWFGVMGATALFFGVSEARFEEWLLPRLDPQGLKDFLVPALMGLYLVPLLTHYIYDGWLWKSNHPEARLIYRP